LRAVYLRRLSVLRSVLKMSPSLLGHGDLHQ
jgi:hypothetical protein